VDIESIQTIKEEQQRYLALSKSKDLAAEARKTANRVASLSIADMSFEFSMFADVE